MYMAKLASRNGGEDPSVTYGDLAAVVQRKESMEFLHDILPKKVNVFLICIFFITFQSFYAINTIKYIISLFFILFRSNMASI